MTDNEKEMLSSTKLVVSMLETADDNTGRFKKLIADMKMVEQYILVNSEKVTPENAEDDAPIEVKGGKVSAVKPSQLGISSSGSSGGKVTPVKG